VVVVVHGIRDHATRYAALAKTLNGTGLAVYSYDLRGHGSSGGYRQRFDSLEQLLADTDLLVQDARRKTPSLPVFIYGHSLGGLISTGYTLAHEPELKGLILSGPALQLPNFVKPAELKAARIFGAILPDLPAQPVDDTGFVNTPAALDDYMKDPLIGHANLPAASAKAGVEGITRVNAEMGKLRLPLLIMHGLLDRQTNIDGSRELNQRAASTDKTLVLWEGQFHDLLHEPDHDKVIAQVTAWLGAHLRPPPGDVAASQRAP
jgi:alpha-beta hydrolase superfamily lysophospholipase